MERERRRCEEEGRCREARRDASEGKSLGGTASSLSNSFHLFPSLPTLSIFPSFAPLYRIPTTPTSTVSPMSFQLSPTLSLICLRPPLSLSAPPSSFYHLSPVDLFPTLSIFLILQSLFVSFYLHPCLRTLFYRSQYLFITSQPPRYFLYLP